jgi:hypothetical protein
MLSLGVVRRLLHERDGWPQVKSAYAELIRKGCREAPDACQKVYYDGFRACVHAVAAIGAGLLVKGPNGWQRFPPMDGEDFADWAHAFPENNIALVCEEHGVLHGLITAGNHFNDTHGWTRERFADWLDEQMEKA